MDEDAKKTALRMIPYGIYVLTAEAPDGSTAAATVNWVTQTSFKPPLVAVAPSPHVPGDTRVPGECAVAFVAGIRVASGRVVFASVSRQWNVEARWKSVE